MELLVVHRSRRDDWSFPKGKAEPGETLEETALREVWEETGFRCRLGAALGTASYADAAGRAKTVWYWAMTAESGQATPNDEVDRMVWAPASTIPQLLDYDTDRSMLERFLALHAGGELGAEAAPPGG